MSTKSNQRSRVQIHLLRKNKPTSGQRNTSDSRKKYLDKPVRKPKEIETCDKSGVFWRRCVGWRPRFWSPSPSCQIITIEIPGNSMTNSGSHSHIHLHYQYTMDETTRSWSERERKRETHAHNQQRTSPSCRIITNELPKYSVTKSGSHSHIHPHYQYTMDQTTRSWSERETHAHNQQGDSDWKKAREKEAEPWGKRMLYQSVTTNIRPKSLSVQIESDVTHICAGRWDPSQSRWRDRKI